MCMVQEYNNRQQLLNENEIVYIVQDWFKWFIPISFLVAKSKLLF
jgi:hypothetical protein